MQTVSTMKTAFKDNNSDNIAKSNFDILNQEFDGGKFYGLEYILEDFFQSTSTKTSTSARPVVDWFGLEN
jgi:hypothetical protein